MFKGSLKVVSRKFQECFEGLIRVFPGRFNSVLRKFQRRFKEVAWMFHKKLEGRLKGVLRQF